jgi:hypothetical protein
VGTNYMAHASTTLFWAREVVREYMSIRRYEIYAEGGRHRGRAMADVVSSKPLFGAPSTRERSLVGAAPDNGIDGRGRRLRMLEGVRDDTVRERWANNREGRDEAAVREVDLNGSTERAIEQNEREVKLSSSLSRCGHVVCSTRQNANKERKRLESTKAKKNIR